jgi:predicted alpha/beta superfamily hydrolase
MFGHELPARIYFVLAGIGLITAWWFNAIATLEGQNYLQAWFGSAVDWVLSLDLLIVILALVVFMLYEAKKLGMKRVWLYFLASGITAMAFTFPLFMAFRELRKQKIAMAFGKLETFEVDNHRVDVWVPEKVVSYTPILMMHDGKNVFDPRTASDNTTWGVLDALRGNKIKADPQPLIIAVHGLGPETRMLELAPKEIVEEHPDIFDNLPLEYKPVHNTSMNGEYNTLLAEKILPMVLEKYGIEHQLERTAIAGSSMGGLASIYLISKYPHLFGAALAFSTHWIIGHEYMAQELSKLVPVAGRHKIYTDSGTEGLDLFYQPCHNKAIKGFEARGYVRDRDLTHAVFPGTGHDEGAWASRVHIPINWWLRG